MVAVQVIVKQTMGKQLSISVATDEETYYKSDLQEKGPVIRSGVQTLQTARPPSDGPRVPHLRVRCPHSRHQADGVKMAANALRYVSIAQIHENVEVPFFVDHVTPRAMKQN